MRNLLVGLAIALWTLPGFSQLENHISALQPDSVEVLLGRPEDDTALWTILTNLAVSVDSTIASLQKYGYNVGNYATLASAISDANGDSVHVILRDRVSIATTTTLSGTQTTLKVLKGGRINNATGSLLTINVPFEAGKYQVFEGNIDSVRFSAGVVDKVYSEWFGAVADDGNDDYAAIQAAVYSVSKTNGGVVELLSGTYELATALDVPANVVLQGAGWQTAVGAAFGNAQWDAAGAVNGTVLQATSTNNGILFDVVTANVTHTSIRDLAILGPGSGTSKGIYANGVSSDFLTNNYKLIDNVGVFNWFDGVDLNGAISDAIYSLTVRGCDTGLTFGDVYDCTDVNLYRLAIENCDTAMTYNIAAGIKIYGGLIQGNTFGINFSANSSGSVLFNLFSGIWFENNTTAWTITGVSQQMQKTTFESCKKTDSAWTWTVNDGELVAQNTFLNNNFSVITVDVSNLSTGGAFRQNNFSGGELAAFTGLGTGSTYVINNSFDNVLLTGTSKVLYLRPTVYVDNGNTGANPTPDWRNGSHQRYVATAALEIQAPTNMPYGAELTLEIRQGGSGGYAITWASGYSLVSWSDTGNTTTKQSFITFKRLGDSFKQVTPQIPYF